MTKPNQTKKVYSKNWIKNIILKWLLKDIELGFNVQDNSLKGWSSMTINLSTVGDIILDGKIVPQTSLVIEEKAKQNQ